MSDRPSVKTGKRLIVSAEGYDIVVREVAEDDRLALHEDGDPHEVRLWEVRDLEQLRVDHFSVSVMARKFNPELYRCYLLALGKFLVVLAPRAHVVELCQIETQDRHASFVFLLHCAHTQESESEIEFSYKQT